MSAVRASPCTGAVGAVLARVSVGGTRASVAMIWAALVSVAVPRPLLSISGVRRSVTASLSCPAWRGRAAAPAASCPSSRAAKSPPAAVPSLPGSAVWPAGAWGAGFAAGVRRVMAISIVAEIGSAYSEQALCQFLHDLRRRSALFPPPSGDFILQLLFGFLFALRFRTGVAVGQRVEGA